MSKRHPLQAFFLAILLIFSCAAAETSSVTEEEAFRSRSATYNGIRSFCGKTYVYYAQNSPEWDKVGLGKGNTVGGAMCATTALSNVIVNSVPCVMTPSGFPYIIFPGNVGNENSLREVYMKLK